MSRLPEPDGSSTELTIAFVKGAMSSVPVVGGLIAEVGGLLFDPLKKREEKWKRAVTDAIVHLTSVMGCDLKELQSNELFVSLVLQASTQARNTHQTEKLTVLRNAIANGANAIDTEEDLVFILMRYIDELTPTHFRILHFLDTLSRSGTEIKSYNWLYGEYSNCSKQSILRPHFKLCCDELGMRNLAHLIGMDDSFDDVVGNPPGRDVDVHAHASVSDIGKRFLALISSPANLTPVELTATEPNYTSKGIRQPAGGSPKPSM